MKKLNASILFVALSTAAAGVLAQQKAEGMDCSKMKGMDMKGMDMKGMDMKCMSKEPTSSKKSSHTAKGVVKKVDAESGMVTIAHGPVKTMNWPAMTMAFKVKDKSMLEKFADGKEVQFDFAEQGKDFVISSVK
jgi:Cu(I)/Ag(I) efflux system protein CusF